MKKLTEKQRTQQLKNQITNIGIIGKVLVQESNMIAGYKKKNSLVTSKQWFTQRAELDKVQNSLIEVIKHFEGRTKAIEAMMPKETK